MFNHYKLHMQPTAHDTTEFVGSDNEMSDDEMQTALRKYIEVICIYIYICMFVRTLSHTSWNRNLFLIIKF